MNADNVLQEFMDLPPIAQREVMDFIAFLRRRYLVGDVTPQSPVPLGKDAFVGLWRDREDMTDAGSWVRAIRTAEWS